MAPFGGGRNPLRGAAPCRKHGRPRRRPGHGFYTQALAMNRRVLLLAAAAALLIGGGALLYGLLRPPTAPPQIPEPVPAPTAQVAPTGQTKPAPVKYPLEKPAEEALPQPLPLTPEQSDTAFASALADFIGQSTFTRWIRPDRIAQRIVATVDNLGRPGSGFDQRLVRYVGGRFEVTGPDESPELSQENYLRYQPLMQLLNAADIAAVASTYRRLYPLLQATYLQLGNTDAYFNDRVVEVIDLLLETPEITTPIALERPGVMYTYRDSALEMLSSGQKLLLRMGPANERQVKVRLRALRALITTGARPE